MTLKREIKDAYIEGGNPIYVKTHSNAVYVDENETETLTKRLDDIKEHTSQLNDITNGIGGRNLALKTAKIKTFEGNGTKNNTIYGIYSISKGLLKTGDTITISFDIEVINANGTFCVQLDSDNWEALIPNNTLIEGKAHYRGTTKIKDIVKFRNGINFRLDDSTSTITISNLKVEEGIIPTSWEPAPEDINEQLNDIKNSLTLNKNNFYANVHLYSGVNIEKTIKNFKKAGIQGIYIVLHIDGNNNCSLTEDLNQLKELQSCAIQNGLKADVLKFHNTIAGLCTDATIQNNYLQQIQNLILQFTGINRIILLNEREDIIQNNLSFALNCVNTIKALGYKVGVSFSNPVKTESCLEKSSSLFNAIDFLGVNNYPSITTIPKKVEFNDSVYAWECREKQLSDIKSKVKCPILLTEVGIIPHEEFLSSPASWEVSKVSSQKNEKIFKYFTYGLFENENLMTKVFDEIAFWFFENSWYADDKTFEYINKYVKRGEN